MSAVTSLEMYTGPISERMGGKLIAAGREIIGPPGTIRPLSSTVVTNVTGARFSFMCLQVESRPRPSFRAQSSRDWTAYGCFMPVAKPLGGSVDMSGGSNLESKM